ncbi:hypothetical protein SNE40_022496 [Patella caerulea]|uniref:DDE Tnp4 domain-containing protein n=2 Tax=Patella caerulea TaxID=87958 RepID=A0AAN8G458_PATCE
MILYMASDLNPLICVPLWKQPTYKPAIYLKYGRFKLDSLCEKEVEARFRFKKAHLPRLLNVLNVPDRIICPDRTAADKMEALCIFLQRMAYPNRLCEMEKEFGRSSTSLSFLANTFAQELMDAHGHLLSDIQQPWIVDNLQEFADSIHKKGAAMTNIWGFIDGTVRPICRPTHNQRLVYNGHKRTHSLNYQSVVLPNGLIANMYGPIEGRRHDAGMLRESGLLPLIEGFERNGEPMALYGDPAYPLRPQLVTPYRGDLTDEQEAFNRSMSMARVSVEWIFGKIVTYWPFIDFKKNQKLYLQPVGLYYLTCALLTNFHTCLYGSEVGNFFNLQPPSLEDYIQGN